MTERKRNSKKRHCLTALALAAALSGWFIWEQNGIATESVLLTVSDLPSAFEGLRIAHLSDLHGKEFGENNQRLLSTVAQLEPDLIFITGDLIDREEQLEIVPDLAQGLSAIAPTCYVTGNHEWAVHQVKQLKALLREHGVTVLTNEYLVLERADQTLVVAGVDDPNGPADQKTPAQLRAEIAAEVGADVCTLLLSHRDTVEDYASLGYDVVFCGHGHGGVVRIPVLNRGVLGSNRTFFPEYDGGAYEIGREQWCVVSRGLGSNTVPFQTFRLFNRPHLPVVTLTR